MAVSTPYDQQEKDLRYILNYSWDFDEFKKAKNTFDSIISKKWNSVSDTVELSRMVEEYVNNGKISKNSSSYKTYYKHHSKYRNGLEGNPASLISAARSLLIDADRREISNIYNDRYNKVKDKYERDQKEIEAQKKIFGNKPSTSSLDKYWPEDDEEENSSETTNSNTSQGSASGNSASNSNNQMSEQESVSAVSTESDSSVITIVAGITATSGESTLAGNGNVSTIEVNEDGTYSLGSGGTTVKETGSSNTPPSVSQRVTVQNTTKPITLPDKIQWPYDATMIDKRPSWIDTNIEYHRTKTAEGFNVDSAILKRYYSVIDAEVYFGNEYVEDIHDISWTIIQNVMPIFGYNSYTYDEIARGNRVIQGNFLINFTSPNYLFAILEEANSANTNTITNMTTFNVPALQNNNQYVARKRSTNDRERGHHANMWPQTFDIDIIFGEKTGVGEPVHIVLLGCAIQSCQQILSASATGAPPVIMEQYSFVGRDIRTVILSTNKVSTITDAGTIANKEDQKTDPNNANQTSDTIESSSTGVSGADLYKLSEQAHNDLQAQNKEDKRAAVIETADTKYPMCYTAITYTLSTKQENVNAQVEQLKQLIKDLQTSEYRTFSPMTDNSAINNLLIVRTELSKTNQEWEEKKQRMAVIVNELAQIEVDMDTLDEQMRAQTASLSTAQTNINIYEKTLSGISQDNPRYRQLITEINNEDKAMQLAMQEIERIGHEQNELGDHQYELTLEKQQLEKELPALAAAVERLEESVRIKEGILSESDRQLMANNTSKWSTFVTSLPQYLQIYYANIRNIVQSIDSKAETEPYKAITAQAYESYSNTLSAARSTSIESDTLLPLINTTLDNFQLWCEEAIKIYNTASLNNLTYSFSIAQDRSVLIAGPSDSQLSEIYRPISSYSNYIINIKATCGSSKTQTMIIYFIPPNTERHTNNITLYSNTAKNNTSCKYVRINILSDKQEINEANVIDNPDLISLMIRSTGGKCYVNNKTLSGLTAEQQKDFAAKLLPNGIDSSDKDSDYHMILFTHVDSKGLPVMFRYEYTIEQWRLLSEGGYKSLYPK